MMENKSCERALRQKLIHDWDLTQKKKKKKAVFFTVFESRNEVYVQNTKNR